jgi:riboflavin kinase / FMN adenylyltransferase
MKIHVEGTLSLNESVIAIGAFDGVHKGHQEVIRQTVERSKLLGVPSVVYTFDPPPRHYFQGAQLLTNVQEKVARIAQLGIDHVVIARFDEAYTKRTAAEFMTELTKLGTLEVFVGHDFQFGRNRAGDVGLLSRHFPVHLTEPVHCSDGKKISSTRIRLLLSQGETQKSGSLLGW